MTQLELPFFDSRVFPVLVALIPAAGAWWRGRALTRRLDDPTLPEQLIASRRGNSAALVVSIALLVILWPKATLWTLPLLVVARLTASYAVRRALFQETWSLGAYLSFFIRLIVAAFGFWILLSASPHLIGLAGPYRWPAAAALASILAAWNARNTDVFGWLLGARALDDPPLVARLTRLVQASGVRPPRFERVDMHGGVLANAVALPSRRESAVAFTDTLLSRLDADEVVAIGAHEIGHLEHYNARRLRQVALVNNALIGVAVLTPAFGYLLPWAADGLTYAWPGLLLVTLVARARNRQHNETAADLRALALTGDPEALIRGLTKLHAIARIPRRWASQFERQATHPSLARRIKAIRDAAGAQPAPLGEPVTLNSADGSASVVFRDDRLEWNEQALAQHSIKYAHMTELRLDARRPDAPRLLVVDGRGRRWEVPIMAADVGRAQAAMDVVDVRTANQVAPPHSPALALVRFLALSVAVTAGTISQLAVVVVALVAAAEPVPPLLAAAGCAALAAAGLTLRDPPWPGVEAMTSPSAIVAGLLALGLLWAAAVHRKGTVSSRAWKLVTVLAICAVLSWVAILSIGFNAVRLHQVARAWPSAAVFSLSFAAAVGFHRSRLARVGAVAAAVAGLVAIGAGSDTFLEAFSRDALVTAAEPFHVRPISPRRLAQFSVPFDVTGLRLSPTGRTIALLSENDDEQATVRLGPAGGPFTAFDANEAVFIDDDRVLLLEQHQSAGATLREAAIGATSSVVYERQIKGVFSAGVFYDTKTNTWAVVGQNRDGQIVRVSGTPGHAAVEEQRWTLPTRAAAGISVISASERDALIMETRYDGSALGTASPLLLSASLLAGGPWTESQLWTIGAHGATSRASTQFSLNCVAGHVDEVPAVCAAFDGVRTRLFTIARAGLTPVGSLSGRFFLYGPSDSDGAAGWWDNSRVLLRLSTHEALLLEDAREGAIVDVAVGNTMLGVITRTRAATVRLYARP